MAKKEAPRNAKPAVREASLGALRKEIDRIDRELVKLMNRRAAAALKIGKLKDSTGQTIYAPGREHEVLARAVEWNEGPLTEQCIRSVFRELISGSRSIERRYRVAYLGPEYSYCHLAAIEKFGQAVDLVPVVNIPAIFEEVNRGHANYGLVPLENSTDGRVADTLEMFTRLPVRICGEVQLWIHHCLLSRSERSEVTEVYSRPQALSQCRNWLSQHLMGARLIEVTSTSTAAKLAQDKPGAAAIASREAAQHYGLDVLAESIEDNQANLTRFAVIGPHPADRTGKDKTACMFEVEHRPGTLAEAMHLFKRNRVNLTWIESFPIPHVQGRYLFFVEVDGHQRDARVQRAFDALGRRAVRMEILGSYPKTEPIG